MKICAEEKCVWHPKNASIMNARTVIILVEDNVVARLACQLRSALMDNVKVSKLTIFSLLSNPSINKVTFSRLPSVTSL